MKHLGSWILGFGIVALIGCGGGPEETPPAATGKPKVVATIGMIADVAARIAGDHADVEGLMASGIDPHLYKASEGDVSKLQSADLILYNGLNLEGKMADVLVKVGRQRPVLAVTEEVSETFLREPPEFAGHYDPHIWFDVELWQMILDPIARELSAVAPAHAAEFKANAEKLKVELTELEAWVKSEIAKVPESQRVLVTAHDAFGYFGAKYGFEVVGIQGISTVSEAGLKDVERVVNLIVSRKIKAIFVESSVPRRAIEAVQEACRAKGHEVAIGGELFSDAMGAPGTEEGTYVGMVRHNVTTIVNALQ